MSDAPVPARVDRAALERILQRAAELQASEHDLGEGLSAEEVLALGREVGIPAQHLRQAMLEERSRVSRQTPEGFLDQLVGPAEVSAVRVVRGTPEAAERVLLKWMEKQELMALQRQQPGRLSWERLTGVQAAMRRGISSLEGAKARYMLSRASVVRATVTPLEDGYCHVALSAEIRSARAGILGGSAALAGIGMAGGGILAALGAVWFLPLAPVVGGLAASWAVSRGHRPVADRTQLGLERVLDYVEGQAIKPVHEVPERGPGLLHLLGNEVRKAIAAAGSHPPERRPRKP